MEGVTRRRYGTSHEYPEPQPSNPSRQTHTISLIYFHILIMSSHSLIPPHHPGDVFQDLYGFIISPLVQYAPLA